MLKVGKRVEEVICPLCENIYLMGKGEYKIFKDKNDNKLDKLLFYCPECDRNVYSYFFKESIFRDKNFENYEKKFAYKE